MSSARTKWHSSYSVNLETEHHLFLHYRMILVPSVPGTLLGIAATPCITRNDRGERCNLLAHLHLL